jgi:penicillin-binding protein 1A
MARRKQLLVLNRMVEKEFLTRADADNWGAQPLVYMQATWQERESASAFFVEEVRRYLMAHFGGEEVLTGGLTVHTTLDIEDQVSAWQAVRRGLRAHDRRMGFRGPLRNVPKAETEAVLAEIATSNGAVVEGEDPTWRALVLALDNEKQVVTLALGPEERTTLGIADLNWAGKPNPARDGISPRVSRVGEALRVGDLVLLEDVTEPGKERRFALYQRPLAEGALVAVDLEKAQLRAVVGGYSFAQSEFNRALQSRRQPGSAFKPIVYAAAIARGYTPATIVQDTAIVYEDHSRGFAWKPENYSEDFLGPITLRTALAKSRNAATIRILSDIGIAPVRDMARALGIESKMEENLGLALGNSEVTLAELVRAYTPFATGGKRIDPIFILEVRDRSGRVIAKDVPLLASLAATPEMPPVSQGSEESVPAASADEVEQIMEKLRREAEAKQGDGLPQDYMLDPVDAYLVTEMLRAVVTEGTGGRANDLGRPVAGKTGTTNDLRDAWFIGYTPEIAAGVWVGFDNAHNLGANETGGRASAPIFVDYLKQALRDRPKQDFAVPEGIVFARIDRATGLLAAPGNENALFMPFREGTAPLEVSPAADSPGGALRPLRVD